MNVRDLAIEVVGRLRAEGRIAAVATLVAADDPDDVLLVAVLLAEALVATNGDLAITTVPG